MNREQCLTDMIRLGVVTAVDAGARKARVKFQDSGNTSGWLYVLQHHGAKIDVTPDGSHTHSISDTYSGGGSASVTPHHDHTPTRLAYWTPKVNDTVLTLYLPVFNGDGFILGGV